MTQTVLTGLDNLKQNKSLQKEFSGNIGYLCHAASVDKNIRIGVFAMKEMFGDRFKKIFTPQHGLVGDVQDNMVETNHFEHPYFKLPIYSLYSETRVPSDEMLEGLDHIFIDLQDVGTRIYTYVYTMTHMMEACQKKGIEVIILDRPNPIDGNTIEGNVLDTQFTSFVGRHPCPTRHGLTMGEFALMAKKHWGSDCNLRVIEMSGWDRASFFDETDLPWVIPSPNFPTVDSGFPFVGTVLFEGTNISEGRGTTRALEYVGHPAIEPYSFLEHLNTVFAKTDLCGFILRPVVFLPTFQKHAGKSCGGYQIHVTDRRKFKPWRVSQILCQEFYHHLGSQFQWKRPPYEYVHDKLPIDIINGTDKIREWIESKGAYDQLDKIEKEGMEEYLKQRQEILLY